MRVWRYILSLFVGLVVLQLAAIALTIALGTPSTVDTDRSRKTIFQTDSKMAVYASPIVARGSDRKQVVILGSSNTTMGLRPDKLQPYLGEIRIHNLSIGSEKFRGIPQMVDLLYRQTAPDKRKNYLFVIGISYPLIADDDKARIFMRTSIDDEELRFGLFRYGTPLSTPHVDDRYLSQALQAAWPFLVPKALYNSIIRLVPEPYWFGLAEPVPFSPEESNTVQYTPAQHKTRIDYFNAELWDSTGAFTFDPLMQTIARITAEGGEVVVVDLPTAKWLRDATGLYAAYVKLRKPYITRLEKMKHVRYINAERGFKDKDFYDGVHPRNRIAGDIAKAVAPTIKQALEELK